MGKQLPLRFLKQFAFWLLFFAFTRAIFLLYNTEELKPAGPGEILASFFQALYVDVAMTCYLMALPFLFCALQLFWPLPLWEKLNRGFTLLLIVCVSIITIAELPIYDEWAHKLTYKAIWFLRNPAEVFHTASWSQLIFGTIGIVALSLAGWWLFRKIIGKSLRKEELQRFTAKEFFTGIFRGIVFLLGGRWWMKRWLGTREENSRLVTTSFFLLATLPLLFIGLRGGLQPIPIQVSDAYYSQHNILNNASVNSTFHLMSSIAQSTKTERYDFLPESEAQQLFEAMHRTEKDTTISILKMQRPNVVLIVLESWSADLVKSMGGFEGVTPRFDEMMKQGIVFDSCYASGSLSDQGMAAVFSGFPAQPHTSIITQPDKYVHLPCLNDGFRAAGYQTAFMFGGQLSYGNIRAYMYYNQFDRITEGKDFDASVPQGRLGVHDEYLYAQQLKDIRKMKEPFFSAMFTLSTHGPFDIPMKKDKLKWGDKEQDYINSAYYADSCIYTFIENAKKEPWYKNTLFVFVADHSHNTPKNYSYTDPEYRRIVTALYGEPIKEEFRGYRHKKICSQVDLASTLSHQLGMDASRFRYSKNLFNPYTPGLAYYSYEGGFGFVHPDGQVVHSISDGKWLREKARSPQALEMLKKQGKAYLQVMFDEYLKY